MYCGRFLWDDDVCCSTNKMLVNEVTELNCNVRELNSNLKTLLEVLSKSQHHHMEEAHVRQNPKDFSFKFSNVVVVSIITTLCLYLFFGI